MSNTKKASATFVDYRAMIEAAISGEDRPTKRAQWVIQPALHAAYVRAQERLDAAVMANPSREDGKRAGTLGEDPVKAARDARDEALAALRRATVYIVFRALPEHEFRAWSAANPESENVPIGLVEKCFVGYETIDGEPIEGGTFEPIAQAWPGFALTYKNALHEAALLANCQSLDVPSSALR